jgi:SOS response regulatory protein OraA/RecX
VAQKRRHDTRKSAQGAPRSRPEEARGAGVALCRALRDDAREIALLSRPQIARAGLERRRRGYVDDAAYALSNAQSLAGRGYGKRRLIQKLRIAGVDEADGEDARAHADEAAVSSALRFAERRRLGPFASTPYRDPRDREKALAAMIRAGHSFDLARAILGIAPGSEVDLDHLSDRAARR